MLALVFEKFKKIRENNFFQKIALGDLVSPLCTEMTPNSIGFYCSTYVTTRCDMVTVECIESKKSEGQTSKQIYKQKNQRRRKDYSRRATITREPLGKGIVARCRSAYQIHLTRDNIILALLD